MIPGWPNCLPYWAIQQAIENLSDSVIHCNVLISLLLRVFMIWPSGTQVHSLYVKDLQIQEQTMVEQKLTWAYKEMSIW